uniref:Methionine aminopeptidase 1A n=1 Tax=Arundo donax TaxID=35708 RepID=A0A0A9GBK2_ARUDO
MNITHDTLASELGKIGGHAVPCKEFSTEKLIKCTTKFIEHFLFLGGDRLREREKIMQPHVSVPLACRCRTLLAKSRLQPWEDIR